MATAPNNITPFKEQPTGLALLRAPFPDHQISKLPKPTKAQTEKVRADFKAGIRCEVCGSWHHPDVVHLDYVGHAALTDRLLDADPAYACEPMAHGEDGLPMFDRGGGLWVRLTVCGVTRMGYGDADGKQGGNAIKEAIGDAMRNAAMRFGAALDLWHKGDLHLDEDAATDEPAGMPDAEWAKLVGLIQATSSDTGAMCKLYGVANLRALNQDDYADALAKLNTKLAKAAKADTDKKGSFAEELGDDIPY